MTQSGLIPAERIEKAIYLIRGEKVMLDRDLAALDDVETRVLNQAVQRNRVRFPADFMFELTRDEIAGISQIVTSSKLKFSKRVTAFTEQGVAMIATVLRSSVLFKLILKLCGLLSDCDRYLPQMPNSHSGLMSLKTNTTASSELFLMQSER